MKSFLIVSMILFSFVGTAFSYPESQMDDCMKSALNNPATKSISESSISKYCDCALTAIFDQNKDVRDSGYECAQKNFN